MSKTDQRVDAKGNSLLSLSQEILCRLLADKTTQQNIVWATDDYAYLGPEYASNRQIQPELIIGESGNGIIRPRTKKTKAEQTARAKSKAEVFTPSWVCNKQNNLIDASWFGYENVFNIESGTGWTPTKNKIVFHDGKTWRDYVMSTQLEVSCGEAPYLVSRYDTVTGKAIPVNHRIGLLDRKLRVVSENCDTEEEWLEWATKAVQHIYGYDWQGDNVLLARINLLFTFSDFFEYKFNKPVNDSVLLNISTILHWNVIQMDGIKCVVPNSCSNTFCEEVSMHGKASEVAIPCIGCLVGDHNKHNGIYAKIYDWSANHPVVFRSLMDPAFDTNNEAKRLLHNTKRKLPSSLLGSVEATNHKYDETIIATVEVSRLQTQNKAG